MHHLVAKARVIIDPVERERLPYLASGKSGATGKRAIVRSDRIISVPFERPVGDEAGGGGGGLGGAEEKKEK